MSKADQLLTLPDGRRLGYDEHGPLDGKPLLYFHGTPGSRPEGRLFIEEESAERLNVRVVAPDRPGMGLSDFEAGCTMGDWPADVAALADALALERFAVLGYSGGGPYALACALKIPERLTAVGIVSSPAPYDVPGLTDGMDPNNLGFIELAHQRPRLSRLAHALPMGIMPRLAPGRFVAQAMTSLPEPDRKVLARPEFRQGFVESIVEAQRGGARGERFDTALMAPPWGFDLREIRTRAHLWHGCADRNAPLATGRFLASALPACEAHFCPEEGHLSLFANRSEDVLGALIA